MLRAIQEATREIDRKPAIRTTQPGGDNIGPGTVGNHRNRVTLIDAQKKSDRPIRACDLGDPPRQHRLDRVYVAAIAR
jgi:hypothetical protein